MHNRLRMIEVKAILARAKKLIKKKANSAVKNFEKNVILENFIFLGADLYQ
jgi:hypothetical protein